MSRRRRTLRPSIAVSRFSQSAPARLKGAPLIMRHGTTNLFAALDVKAGP